MCKSWCEVILGLIILLFTFWKTTYSDWVVIIAAVILVLHSFMCKSCFSHREMPMKTGKKR